MIDYFVLRALMLLFFMIIAAPLSANTSKFSLSPGFSPEAGRSEGLSGGPDDAAIHGNTSFGPCAGRIDETPDHVMVLTADFSYLRVHVKSLADTSLVISGPDGYRCNDDTDGINPVIEGEWQAGTYFVYVGSVTAGNHPYTILITERRLSETGRDIEEKSPASPPEDAFEHITLSSGMSPFRRELSGLSGGFTDASGLGGTEYGYCSGLIDDSPDHIMVLSSSFEYLKVHAISSRDISLVIKGPAGLMCNEENDDINPVIKTSWPAGRYEIFIGSVEPGMHPYTLIITDIREKKEKEKEKEKEDSSSDTGDYKEAVRDTSADGGVKAPAKSKDNKEQGE